MEGRDSREAGGGQAGYPERPGSSPPRLWPLLRYQRYTPPRSSPGLFFMARWILCSPHTPPPFSYLSTVPSPPPHAAATQTLSTLPQPLSYLPSSCLLSFWSSSFKIHLCLPLIQPHPSLPVPTCPLLSSCLPERGPEAYSHLSPERPSPLIFSFRYPRAPSPVSRFP